MYCLTFLVNPAKDTLPSNPFQISASKRVQISKAKLSSTQSCILVFEDIAGRVSVNGRIECIGCNHPSEEHRAKKVPNSMLAFFVQSVSTFAIEDSLVNAPLRYNNTVFKNHRKSLIQHCERSELRLHFEWTKVNQKCQIWSILASF